MKAALIKALQSTLAIVLALGAGIGIISIAAADSPPVEQWVQRFSLPDSDSRASAIAVDGSGNAYVTGSTWNHAIGQPVTGDIVTIKYSSSGAWQWTKTYNHTGSRIDQAQAIAVDSTGNAYVAGYGWGSGSNDFITIKYGTDGTELWVRTYDNSNRSAEAMALALDGRGNPVVTGYGNNAAGNSDYITVKYSADGTQLWEARYDGTGNGTDEANAIAIDPDGNACVTGSSAGPGGDYDFATVKYGGAGGTELWAKRYDGPDNNNDYGVTISTDASGNVFAAGNSYNNSGNSDYTIVKYSPNGTELWSSRYNGTGKDSYHASAIAVDGNGNAVVTGYGDEEYSDWCTVKYSTTGSLLWAASYTGPRHESGGWAIAVDGSDNTFVTGQVDKGWGSDYATVKYSPGGTQLWAARYHGPSDPDRHDRAMAIALLGSSVYVTGWSGSSNNNDFDYATLKYVQAPVLTSVRPDSAAQGRCHLTVTINGACLEGATAVSFGAGITVNRFSVNSATSITAVVCIDGNAAVGMRSISVTTPGGTATLPNAFKVTRWLMDNEAHSSPVVTAPATQAPPIINPVIVTQGASLSATTAAPGSPVTVTADIVNRSTAAGSKNIQVYVNGQPEASKGVNLGSGGSTQVAFSIARDEPGTYDVVVDSTPAGSFTVETAGQSGMLLIASSSLITLALIAGTVMLVRRKRT